MRKFPVRLLGGHSEAVASLAVGVIQVRDSSEWVLFSDLTFDDAVSVIQDWATMQHAKDAPDKELEP